MGSLYGTVTNGDVTGVIWSVLQVIRQLRKLEITAVPEFRPWRYLVPSHTIEGLEVLIINNSGLTQFQTPGSAGAVSRLVRLDLVRQDSFPDIRWDHFCSWLKNSATTLEYLRLEATFSEHQHPNVTPPAVFSRLLRVKTSPDLLLRFHRSSIHTPALKQFAITRTRIFDVDAWQTYAADVRGGKGIREVRIAGK